MSKTKPPHDENDQPAAIKTLKEEFLRLPVGATFNVYDPIPPRTAAWLRERAVKRGIYLRLLGTQYSTEFQMPTHPERTA